MGGDEAAPAPGMEPPPEDPALAGPNDPGPQMNQDAPPETNPYVPQPQQPLQFSRKYMSRGGRSKKRGYRYRPPFAMVDVGFE